MLDPVIRWPHQGTCIVLLSSAYTLKAISTGGPNLTMSIPVHRSCLQFHFTSSTPLTVLRSLSKVSYWKDVRASYTSGACSLTYTIAFCVACAKIQFRVSTLMNEVMDALSTVEVLSSFEYHDLLKSVSDKDKRMDAEPMKAPHAKRTYADRSLQNLSRYHLSVSGNQLQSSWIGSPSLLSTTLKRLRDPAISRRTLWMS